MNSYFKNAVLYRVIHPTTHYNLSTICITDFSAWPVAVNADNNSYLFGGVCLAVSMVVERQSPWATFIICLHNNDAETVCSIKEITGMRAMLQPKCAVYH